MLIQLAARFPEAARSSSQRRTLLTEAISADRHGLEQALSQEQEAERAMDRKYWEPLKGELEKLRRDRR